MLSILFISPNQNLTDVVTPVLERAGCRFKHVMDLKSAYHWITLARYDVLMVDQDFDNADLFPFFMEGWKNSDSIRSILVSLNDPHPEKIIFKSVGVAVIGGKDLAENINIFLDKYPKNVSLTENAHQRVLVVDDLDSPRAIICSLIESLGFPHVAEANSVNNAIKTLLVSPLSYFCIVTDINMPGEDGFSLISRVREELSLAYLPIIVLTSDPSDANLIRALKYGISGFLAKPPKRPVLQAELAKAKRMVMNGLSPEVGTAAEIRILEKEIRKKK